MHSTERSHFSHEAHRPTPTGFRGHLSRGLHLTRTSLRVLLKDSNLLAIPLLALVVIGFVWLLVTLSLVLLGFPPASPSSSFLYQELFVAYLITYFLSTYFMASILGAAHARLEGRKPTLAEGLQAANASVFRLLGWSLVASTVGVCARLASLRWEGASRVVARVFGASWPIASVFVLPAVVMEGLGPVKAFRRSRTLLKEIWSADERGVLGTGVTFALLFLVGLVPFLWGTLGDGGGLAVFASVLYWLLLTVLWSVVHAILVTALYHYATASEASFGFQWQALNHPWVR